jgi:hypothetical protein
MKKIISQLSLFLFAILLVPSAYSQDFNNKTINRLGCATPPMTELQRKYTLNVVDKAVASRKGANNQNSGTTCVPIRIHRVMLDNRTGGVAIGDINKGVANLNKFYLKAGIEFYIASISDITSSEWYDFQQSEETAMTSGNSIYDAPNVYFVGKITTSSGGGACGYAYYPADAIWSLNILMDNDCLLNGPNGTFVHEFGHFFNLAHTHQYTESGNTDPNAENVPRAGANANCGNKGDLLCDTQADPNGSNNPSCNFINDGTSKNDINGQVYAPDIDNIMSYYTDACGGIFTPEQYTRMANGLATRLKHTTYNLDAPPIVVTNASGLTATLNNSSGVDLAWIDNAVNEFGYLIERSSDGGRTWVSLIDGGVSFDITSYTDTKIYTGNQLYKYRIKASNDNCNDYSNEASTLCIPNHENGSCDPNKDGLGIAIYNVQLDGDGTGDISNLNNGCTGPLSVFNSNHSANVTAGNNYNVVVDFYKGGRAYDQFFTIWMDVNQDGDFDDGNEKIYQSTIAKKGFTAPITIPQTAMNGYTTMRIRSGYSKEVTSPCAYNPWSEAEDYQFVVSGGRYPDSTPPIFENSTPSISSVTQSGFTLGTDINEAGIIYYVVVADGASAPTSAEVKSGRGSGDVGQIDSGNTAVTSGDFSKNFSVTNLSKETAYDVYVVAEDDNGIPNLQVSPKKIDVATYLKPTITFSNIISTYGDANFNLGATSDSGGTITYSIEGENTTGTSLSATNNKTVTLGNAGSIIIRATQAANGSFSSETKDITLTISTAALTITADSGLSKIYGSYDPTLAYTITGFLGADNEASLDTGVSISRTAGENVASYVVTPSAAADTNYSISFVTSVFNITQAALTVTADSGLSKIYGSYDPTLAYTITGFLGADNEANLDTGVSISRVAGENVASYVLTPSAAADTNYSISYATSSFTIIAATLTITGLTGDNKVDDGTTEATASGTPVLSGVQTGDVVSLGGAPVFTFASADVGTGIVITTTGYTISGVESVNYSLTQPILSADITAGLGVDDVSLIALLEIYPNPIVNELFIKTNSIQLEQVIIYDVLGKSIINTKLNLDKIDVSTLKVGMYLLKIKTDRGTVVRRILKK